MTVFRHKHVSFIDPNANDRTNRWSNDWNPKVIIIHSENVNTVNTRGKKTWTKISCLIQIRLIVLELFSINEKRTGLIGLPQLIVIAKPNTVTKRTYANGMHGLHKIGLAAFPNAITKIRRRAVPMIESIKQFQFGIPSCGTV